MSANFLQNDFLRVFDLFSNLIDDPTFSDGSPYYEKYVNLKIKKKQKIKSHDSNESRISNRDVRHGGVYFVMCHFGTVWSVNV